MRAPKRRSALRLRLHGADPRLGAGQEAGGEPSDAAPRRATQGAATVGADLTEPLADSIATSSATVIEDGAWAATPLFAEPVPAIAATTPGKARRVKAASKVARALGGPTGRRVRRLTAGLLASAEARIRPVEPEPER